MAPQVPIVAPTKSSSEFLGRIKQFASLRRSTPSVFPLQPRWKFFGDYLGPLYPTAVRDRKRRVRGPRPRRNLLPLGSKVPCGVRSLIDLPGDQDGGMFGLRRIEPPLTPAEKLARALLHARLLGKGKTATRGRGRGPVEWRKVLLPFIAWTMRMAPQLSNRKLAEYLLTDADGPHLNKEQNISQKTVENWLVGTRKLAESGEPLEGAVDIKALEALWPQLVATSKRG
jgi:hypothetical protein